MSKAKECFSPGATNKALVHILVAKLFSIVPQSYPQLMPLLGKMAKTIEPVRLSKCGRFLQAFGRSYEFAPSEAVTVKSVVRAFRDGTIKVSIVSNPLGGHPIAADGILCFENGAMWLQDPEPVEAMPILVQFTADADPHAGIEKEALSLAWLTMHPEWTDDQIADKIGCGRTNLYHFKKYRAARAMLKEGRQAYKDWQQTEHRRPA